MHDVIVGAIRAELTRQDGDVDITRIAQAVRRAMLTDAAIDAGLKRMQSALDRNLTSDGSIDGRALYLAAHGASEADVSSSPGAQITSD